MQILFPKKEDVNTSKPGFISRLFTIHDSLRKIFKIKWDGKNQINKKMKTEPPLLNVHDKESIGDFL